MSILSQAKKREQLPLVATFVGIPGTGKTSLACTFDAPFLISTQGESVPRDILNKPDQIGTTETSESLFEQMRALYQEEHDYKTLIIDSVTGLEQMFIQEVLKSDPRAKSINQALGGYGAGMNAVSAMHARVRAATESLRTKRGMTIIFIGHADITRIDPPDNEGFNQYTIRLANKSMAPYVDNVDLVGFLHQETILRGEEGERKLARTSGNIIMTCTLNPAYGITKNRLGISDEIVIEKNVNPLKDYL